VAAARGVPSFTLALGIDSLLVLRSHTCASGGDGGADADAGSSRLSCYFCADPTAPTDSSGGRAMDEACTISRPGLAPIASALAAELVVALLHHGQRFAALDCVGGAGSPLGAAPQQLRLDLQTLAVREGFARAFAQCAACSEAVLAEYRRDRGEFLGQALGLEGPAYLEQLSGLAALKARVVDGCGGDGAGAEDEDWAAC
jgi:ubiquitin-like modifier-activating enzyme ATG7